jgi:hypothetical protein
VFVFSLKNRINWNTPNGTGWFRGSDRFFLGEQWCGLGLNWNWNGVCHRGKNALWHTVIDEME